MKYFSVDFTIECAAELLSIARDVLADAAAGAGLEAFEDTADGLKGWVQEQLFDRTHLQMVTQDLLPGVKISFTVERVEDRDWNHEWEKLGFDPIDIADRLVITDARRGDSISADDHRLHINIRARNAFGTGTHHTTRLMLEALMTEGVTDKRVLDCGCGTGILGIAAAKMGACEVVAYDIDEWSVENSQFNAEANGVSNIQVLHGDAHVLSHVSGLFGIVMANINRNILLADIPSFHEVMAGDGTLIISGFYEEDVQAITACAARYGLHVSSRSTSEEWCCLVLKMGH